MVLGYYANGMGASLVRSSIVACGLVIATACGGSPAPVRKSSACESFPLAIADIEALRGAGRIARALRAVDALERRCDESGRLPKLRADLVAELGPAGDPYALSRRALDL